MFALSLGDQDLLMNIEKVIAENNKFRTAKESDEASIFESNSASVNKPSRATLRC